MNEPVSMRMVSTLSMLSIMLVILVLSIQMPLSSGLSVIEGQVVDKKGIPLKASVASILNFRAVRIVETDSNGFFTLQIDQGVVNILVYSDDKTTPGFDYVPALVKVDVSNRTTIVLLEGASAQFEGDVQFVETESLPT